MVVSNWLQSDTMVDEQDERVERVALQIRLVKKDWERLRDYGHKNRLSLNWLVGDAVHEYLERLEATNQIPPDKSA